MPPTEGKIPGIDAEPEKVFTNDILAMLSPEGERVRCFGLIVPADKHDHVSGTGRSFSPSASQRLC